MRYFIDTEYLWEANKGRIEPVSIALVAEDGREFYAISTEFNVKRAGDWVKENVLSKLPARHPDSYDSPRLHMEACAWMPLRSIRARLVEFIGDDYPQFWGDYSAFDYVVLSMVMGEFSDWPEGWPMHINDLQQDAIPSVESETPHNALADARAVRDAWNHAFQVAV
jgi:hypothetical protein